MSAVFRVSEMSAVMSDFGVGRNVGFRRHGSVSADITVDYFRNVGRVSDVGNVGPKHHFGDSELFRP